MSNETFMPCRRIIASAAEPRGGRRVRGRAERTTFFTASSASAEARDEVLCVSSNRCSDQSADEPAKERGSDLAPVLRVERGAVMAVVVTVIVVMLRLMMLRIRRRRRRRAVSTFGPRQMPATRKSPTNP